mgnify:CR=1 FL=1|tara:strand:- start:1021 stop:1209 length:189 start_codon:yes stop_codon:yes gene_type:complete
MEWIDVNKELPEEGEYCRVKFISFKGENSRDSQFVNGFFCCSLMGDRPKFKQKNIIGWKTKT